jgi:hypothetical protein
MSKLPEPDDIDLFIGGVEPQPGASEETANFIEDYKKHPDYPREAEEAERILATLGIHPPDYGMQDAESLLQHWQRCVADLLKADHGQTNGSGADQENIGIGSSVPEKLQN